MKETWKKGKQSSVVVSDIKIQNTNFPSPPNARESDDSDIEYYGGYLVCESIGNNQHVKLIASAPDLLAENKLSLEVFKKIESILPEDDDVDYDPGDMIMRIQDAMRGRERDLNIVIKKATE